MVARYCSIALFFGVLAVASQNCGQGFQTSVVVSSEKLESQCTEESIPTYRASVLTSQELSYVVSDLYPEISKGNPEILNILDKVPAISVGKVSDKTIFSSNNRLSMPNEIYVNYLIEVAEKLFQQLTKTSSYKEFCTNDSDCFDFFMDEVERLWRRPLQESEFELFTQIFSEKMTLEEKAELSFITAISSPQFYIKNYLSIRGAGSKVKYRQYDLANRLSFFLYDSVPDKQLLLAAENGELSSPAAIEAQVDRILSDPEYIDRFLENTLATWIGIKNDLSSKDMVTNGEGVSLSVKEMAQHQYIRLKFIMQENKSLSEFFYSDWDLLTLNIAEYLGRESRELGASFLKVEAPGSSYFNSPHFAKNTNSTGANKTLVSERGIYVAEHLLCVNIPVNEVSPEDVVRVLGDAPDSLHQTQVGKIRGRHPSCVGCHGEVDKLGVALELVDAFGRRRNIYPDGKSIDFSFKVNSSQDELVTDFESFAKNFSIDRRLHSCFMKTLVNKVAPIELTAKNPCIDDLAKNISSVGIKDQIKAVILSNIFNHALKESKYE